MTSAALVRLWPRTCGWRAGSLASRTSLAVTPDRALVLDEPGGSTVLAGPGQVRSCVHVRASVARETGMPWPGVHGWWVVDTDERRWLVRVEEWLPAPPPAAGPLSTQVSGVRAASSALGAPLSDELPPSDLPVEVLRPAFTRLGPWQAVRAACVAGPALSLLLLAVAYVVQGDELTARLASALLWVAVLPLAGGILAAAAGWAVWARRGRGGPPGAVEVVRAPGRPGQRPAGSVHRFTDSLVVVDVDGRWTTLPLGDHPGAVVRVADSVGATPSLVLVDRAGAARLALPREQWGPDVEGLLARAGLQVGGAPARPAPESVVGAQGYDEDELSDPEPTGLPHPVTLGGASLGCAALGLLVLTTGLLPLAVALAVGIGGLTVRWTIAARRKIARAEQPTRPSAP